MSNSTAEIFKYGVIIDAGSSGSRVFVYKWKPVNGREPLRIIKAFPDGPIEDKNSTVDGGIHTQNHTQNRINEYLLPLLTSAQIYLKKQNLGADKVPIQLLATGGMRSLECKDQEIIRDFASKTIAQFDTTIFSSRTEEAGARIITGQLEGLYGWVALNYGRSSTEPIVGLQEMGGASIQIAFRDDSGRSDDITRVCLTNSTPHNVYAATWDGYGADMMRNNMLRYLANGAGASHGAVENPCLPRGAVMKLPDGSPSGWTVGTGDFETCLKIARSLLQEGVKYQEPIPSYPAIKPSTNYFLGVSGYWYNYQFFSKWGSYDLHRVYDRQRFMDAVTKYCTHTWGELDVKVDKFTETRCFGAAWMMTLLHDPEYGFGLEMTKYEAWKGFFRFPTTPLLAERSSWTVGAMALIARHGSLKFCPSDVRRIEDGESSGDKCTKPPTSAMMPSNLIIPQRMSPVSNSTMHASASCGHSTIPESNGPATLFVVSPFAGVQSALLLALMAFVIYYIRRARSTLKVTSQPTDMKALYV